jgi:hypothetical protein
MTSSRALLDRIDQNFYLLAPANSTFKECPRFEADFFKKQSLGRAYALWAERVRSYLTLQWPPYAAGSVPSPKLTS